MNKMNKPISVVCEEFKQGLAVLINNSGLPAFIVEPVLRNCLNEVKIIADNQFRLDKSAYEKGMSDCAEHEPQENDTFSA